MPLALDRSGRSRLRIVLATFAAVWIAAMLFVQWLIYVPTSVLYMESVTGLPLINAIYFVRGHLAKPLSPPH